MDPVSKIFCHTIDKQNLLVENSRILVAFSGGPDSTTLLHLLHTFYPSNLVGAAYINHNLRPGEINQEIASVKAFCKKLATRAIIESVDVPSEISRTSESPEACARRL